MIKDIIKEYLKKEKPQIFFKKTEKRIEKLRKDSFVLVIKSI